MNILRTIVLASLGLSLLNSCSSSDEGNTTDQEQSVKVEVLEIQSENRKALIAASGVLQAVKSANLSTRFMGNVESVNVKTGQQVKKGELLLKVNSQDLQAKKAQVDASIAQARSAFENAKKDYERFQNLHKKGSASDKELENMKSRFEMSEAGLNGALNMKKEVEAQFEYLNIRAPFDGNVINVFTKAGDLASPGYPLVSLEGMEQMEAQVMVSEANINQIEIGQKATVLVKSLKKELEAEVSEISRSSKNTGGQYLVKLNVENKDPKVLAGMFINTSILSDSASDNSSILLPEEALFQNGQLKGVYIYSEDHKAILRWIRTGKRHQNKVEVLSGLRSGDRVIVGAADRLYNGLPVTL